MIGKVNVTYMGVGIFVVYYESIKRELKTRPIYECRCDERLTKAEGSTRLAGLMMFIINRSSESYKEDQYMSVGSMKD